MPASRYISGLMDNSIKMDSRVYMFLSLQLVGLQVTNGSSWSMRYRLRSGRQPGQPEEMAKRSGCRPGRTEPARRGERWCETMGCGARLPLELPVWHCTSDQADYTFVATGALCVCAAPGYAGPSLAYPIGTPFSVAPAAPAIPTPVPVPVPAPMGVIPIAVVPPAYCLGG